MSGDLSAIDPVLSGAPGQSAESSWSGWSDWAGMVASIGCAIHCAAMPFVIAYLPALGLSFLADEAFHKWMAVGCFAIALAAFVPGLRKHGRLAPVIVGGVGLAMISFAAFGFAGECCASCESNAASVGVASSDLLANVASLDTAESCTDACCPLCASESSAADSEADSISSLSAVAMPAPSSASSELARLMVPWLTPLGGIVLVIAHLLNRRYGCLCGCCENESVTGIV